MLQSARAQIVRRLPGVGWRSELLARRAEQVERLRGQVQRLSTEADELRTRLGESQRQVALAQDQLRAERSERGHTVEHSFRSNLHNLRRNVEALRPHDPSGAHPVLQTSRKLRNYRLATSHGVAAPEVFGVWSTIDELDLSEIPDEFVLKSDGGAGGKGVFPLRRVASDSYQVIGSDAAPMTTQDLRRHYAGSRSSRRPYFAEQFLTQNDGVEEIPDDIKIYAMYGEVAQVMLRRMPKHADLRSARYRYLDADGVDLGEDVAPGQRIDQNIAAPASFEQFVSIAKHLSRAMALPFIRVDVYDTVDGPVLGELTRAPGGRQRYSREHDQKMGEIWDLAQYRLDLDVQAGRPLDVLLGEHPAPNLYPSEMGRLSSRTITVAPCADWCFGP